MEGVDKKEGKVGRWEMSKQRKKGVKSTST